MPGSPQFSVVNPMLQASSWASLEGMPYPLGATWVNNFQSFNFALYSAAATYVTLLLYTAADLVTPAFTVPLDFLRHKSGPVWHAEIPASSIPEVKYYAYSVDGSNAPGTGGRFDSSKILLDPYARMIFFPPEFSRAAAEAPGSNAGKAPLGVLPEPETAFDWGDDTRPRHTSDTVIYEMHVKGFTNNPNSGVSEVNRGTYLGVIEKIPYLQELGVTVVELLPVFLYDPEEGGDYWGYMPLSFFAPHRGYSRSDDPARILYEFKTLVKALHAAGMEVVLDVVFNHTTEQGASGPTYCYRGIDNASYYLLDSDRQTYLDVTGCGNSVATGQAVMRRLILDSLRFWVKECHVDGFRFDLAGIFSRNDDGSLNLTDPPIVSEITTDPDFAGVRLIAEPYDLDSFELGRRFPGATWLQWNGDFRDTVRQFVRGDNGVIGNLMTRLYGSEWDLFPDDLPNACHPYQSVNFVDCHDGFCLYDLVSYDTSHNGANGPGHEGGTDQNFSDNCGFEGDDGAPAAVLERRRQRVKGLLTLLLLANGTPMFVAGDEFLRTQGGNNNPYNQDNATSYLDWDRLKTNADIFRFFQQMIAFRKTHPTLGRSRFWREDLTWYGVQGSPDLGFTSHTLAFCLRDAQGLGTRDVTGTAEADPSLPAPPGPSLYVLMNFYTQDLTFQIQEGQSGGWRRIVDTSLSAPDDIISDAKAATPLADLSYSVKAQSVVVLIDA